MSDQSVVVSRELISKSQRVAGGKYRYLKLHPTRGASDLAVPRTGTTQVQFEIPTRTINYSKSRLCGNIEIPAGATGEANRITADSVGICSSAKYDLRTGGNMFDTDFIQIYTNVVNRYEKTIDEVVSNNDNGQDAIYSFRFSEGVTFDTLRYDDSPIRHTGIEAQYVAGEDQELAYNHNFRYLLSDVVPKTIFAKKYDIKLPQTGVLTLRLGPANRYAWRTTDEDSNLTGAKALSADPVIKDLHLLLAVQEDPIYEQMMNEKMRAGYTIPLNYVIYSQNIVSKSTSQNVSITYNSGHGKRIKKIYHVVCNDTDDFNATVDHSVTDDTESDRKVQSYHVKINNSRTTEDDLKTDPADPSAYYHHKSLLEGTTITNANIYHYNFCHVEDVGRLGSPAEQLRLGIRTEDVEAGESLAQDYKFEFIAKTADEQQKHYTFAIVQKDMFINDSSVIIN